MELTPPPVQHILAPMQDAERDGPQDEWVERKLAEDFMQNSAATLRAGVLLWLLMLWLLHAHVNQIGLGLWAAACGAGLAYRYFTVQQFKSMVLGRRGELVRRNIRTFFQRHAWSWTAMGSIYAMPIFLFHGKVPPTIEYLSLMILAVMGTIGAALMSAHLACQRGFSNGLSITALGAVLGVAMSNWPIVPSAELLVLAALIWLSRAFILRLGGHLHVLQRSSYSAQFGNEQLIQSLRQQTVAATEAVQAKNSLLASAAHDLRQPVHALAFYADWLRNEPQLAESVIPKILAATDSVNTLFNSLFDFARIESGAIAVNLSDVDIARLVDDMAVQFAPAADAKSLSFRTQTVQAIVSSDAVLLRRVVSNLIANAIRYTETGGVMLSARVVDKEVWLEVSDSGQGIASEHLPHVFKEFYRAPQHQGTADSFGLGLAIVQRLCHAMGHVVSLRSTLGKGTRCRVEIALSANDLRLVELQAAPSAEASAQSTAS